LPFKGAIEIEHSTEGEMKGAALRGNPKKGKPGGTLSGGGGGRRVGGDGSLEKHELGGVRTQKAVHPRGNAPLISQGYFPHPKE